MTADPPVERCGAWIVARGEVRRRSKLLLREGGRLVAEVRIKVTPDAVGARALRDWGLWVIGDDEEMRTAIKGWTVGDVVEVEGGLTLKFEMKPHMETSRAECRMAGWRMVKRCVRG